MSESGFQSRQCFLQRPCSLTLTIFSSARLLQYHFLSLKILLRLWEAEGDEEKIEDLATAIAHGWFQPISAVLTEDWESTEESDWWPGKRAQIRKRQISGTCWRHGDESKWDSLPPLSCLIFLFYRMKGKENGWYLIFSNKPCIAAHPAKANSLTSSVLYKLQSS